MSKFKFEFRPVKFLLGVLAGLIVLGATSCVSHQPIREGARVSMAIGQGTAKADLEGEKIKSKGSSSSARLDLFARPDYLPGLEAGFRLGGVTRDMQATVEEVGFDNELHEAYGSLFLRQLAPVGSVNLYVEGSAGYGYEWGRILGGGEADIRIRDEAGSVVLGLGAGLELSSGLSVGIEWSRRDFDLGPVDLEVQDLAVVVGGVLRF